MRVEHGLIATGGAVTLVGIAILVWAFVAWPEGPDVPPMIRLGEARLTGGSHRLGPYAIEAGRTITLDLDGPITCRNFRHDQGSQLHDPTPRLMVVASARDEAGREVGRGNTTFGEGSCSGALAVRADQDEVTLECRGRLVLIGPMAERVTVDLLLPAPSAPHQDAVQQMHVLVWSSSPRQRRGGDHLWPLVGGACTTPFGLVLLLAGVLVLVMRRGRGRGRPA